MSCEPLLKWESFPLIERPVVSIILIIFLFFLAFVLWQIVIIGWGYPIFYYGGMLLIIATLLPYFIPTSYCLSEDKITIHYLWMKVERKYADFGCFYADKRGIMLSTFKLPRRLDTFRGQSLRFSGSQKEKEALITILKEKIGKQY